jgi:protein TonB
MPRADDPTTRSIFDLLEEKYPRETGPASARPRSTRLAVQAGQPPATPIDGGSRSLLLASLMVLLATALVTLSLKPDFPSTIGDTSSTLDSRARPRPTSELAPPQAAQETATVAPEPVTALPVDPLQPAVRRPPDAEPRTAEPAPESRAAEARPRTRSAEARAPAVEPVPSRPQPPAPSAASAVATVTARADPPERPQLPVKTEVAGVEIDATLTESPEPPVRDTALHGTGALSASGEGVRPAPVEVQPPVRLVTPLPSYTQDAWVAGVQGDVLVRARIDREGTVADVKVLRGLPYGLTEAAVAAVRRWKFRPASIDGEPVSADHDMSIRFSL